MKETDSTKPPTDSISAIIKLYKCEVYIILIRENLKLTME